MKAQVSIEFLLIFGLILFTLSGFFYIINNRYHEIDQQNQVISMKNLANNIISEIVLASSVHDNYIRRFNLPLRLNDKVYTLNVEGNILDVKLFEDNYEINHYFTAIPVPVKAAFIENITLNTSEYCITKNNFDGVRISKNQASIDTTETIVEPADDFQAIISINCIDNVRAIQFTLRYDKEVLEQYDIEPVTKEYISELNPLFDSIWFEQEFDNDEYLPPEYVYKYTDPDVARFSYAYAGTNCASGSGAVARVYFRVKKDIPLGTAETEIVFDPDFGGKELRILDCTTNEFIDVQGSKVTAKIKIK